MLQPFYEKVPQRGKYNLYYTFGKGYINQVKDLREHYGSSSAFSTQRQGLELEQLPDFLRSERHSMVSDHKSGTVKLGSLEPVPDRARDEMNKSRSFDKFLHNKASFEVDSNGLIHRNEGLRPEVTLSSSLRQSSVQNKVRFGSSNRRERFENLALDKKYEFPEFYSDINFMVTRENPQNQKAVPFYKSNFEIQPKNFEPSKIALDQSDNRLRTPLEKRLEIQEVKKNHEKYRSWKLDFMNSQKKYRITKQSFKSGILDIDNPRNDLTKVYAPEFTEYRQKHENQEKIVERHREQIRAFTRTNEDIPFLNNNHRKGGNEKPAKISTNWTGKSRIREDYFKEYQDSHDRLFGSIPNKYSIARANNIMNCSNKGKDWDIICGKIPDFTVKVDRGVGSEGKTQ